MPTAEIGARPRTEPDPVGLQRLARALDAEAVERVLPLAGGAACSVHRVDLAGNSRRSVVLKRFSPANGAPDLEWQALRFASRAPVASPDPLAFDGVGEWFGTPAIAMSLLPGHPALAPDDEEGWTLQLASALVAIHSTDLADYPTMLDRPPIWERLPLAGMAGDKRSKTAESALTILRRTEWEQGFCHCDFHPGNAMYLDGRLTGICDWASARRAPALSDVGRCRAALSIWPGGETPDMFRRHYARMSGRPMDGLALWDLFSAYFTLQFGRDWVRLYEAMGVELDVEQAKARLRALGDRAAGEAGLA